MSEESELCPFRESCLYVKGPVEMLFLEEFTSGRRYRCVSAECFDNEKGEGCSYLSMLNRQLKIEEEIDKLREILALRVSGGGEQ